jgi:DNA primase
MENISIHAAAQKAIEWFHLDPDAMSADSHEDAPQSQEVPKDESAPRPRATSQAAPASENRVPNKPLKFRLDKLQSDHPYLAERGITPETIAEFGVGFCGKGMMADRIAMPIHNPDGQVVAYAGRWPGQAPEGTPKYKLPQGFRKSLEVYNIDRAIKEPSEKPLVIVEGFFGCMTLHQHGYRKVVALMGSAMSAAQEELIRKHTNGQSQVIVMLDEDDAGQVGRDDIASRLAKFCFVKVHQFEKPGTQPEHLSADEVAHMFGGVA